MIIPMFDGEPMFIEEQAEKNVRENEKMRILLEMQKCKTLKDYKELTKKLEETITK